MAFDQVVYLTIWVSLLLGGLLTYLSLPNKKGDIAWCYAFTIVLLLPIGVLGTVLGLLLASTLQAFNII